MELYVVMSERTKLPIVIYDTFDKALQYLYAFPAEHLTIYEYKTNQLNAYKKLSDSYYIFGCH